MPEEPQASEEGKIPSTPDPKGPPIKPDPKLVTHITEGWQPHPEAHRVIAKVINKE